MPRIRAADKAMNEKWLLICVIMEAPSAADRRRGFCRLLYGREGEDYESDKKI